MTLSSILPLQLRDLSETDIVTVKLRSDTLISRSGNSVSPVMPVVFLYGTHSPASSAAIDLCYLRCIWIEDK